jgi:acyl-CoA thioesterase-1
VNPLRVKKSVRNSLAGIGFPAAIGLPAMAGCIAMLLLAGCKDDTGRAEDAAANSAVQPVASLQPASQKRDGRLTNAEVEPNDPRPTLVCFGDSLTAGYGTDPGEAYPDDLQRLLDAQGFKYRVVNAGVSGETTKDGLERVNRIAARHPKIVVLAFGGNDGLRGLPMEQTQANLATMIEQLQKSGVEVVLAGISLPPEYGPDYIAKINAIYPALAKQYHLRLLPMLLTDVYGVPGDMQDDGHHATAKGNKQVAVNVDKLVLPLLKK